MKKENSEEKEEVVDDYVVFTMTTPKLKKNKSRVSVRKKKTVHREVKEDEVEMEHQSEGQKHD